MSRELADSKKSLVILANGPSLNDAGLARLRGLPSILTLSINTPHPALWPTDYWLFCDQQIWTDRHPDLVACYKGTIITCCNVDAPHAAVIDFKPLRGAGFSSEGFARGYFLGRSSTYVALQFAVEKGLPTYIFGLDMDPNYGFCFYGRNPGPFSLPHQRAARFTHEAEHWLHGAQALTESERDRITLCGTAKDWPFLSYFRRLTPSDGVGELLNGELSLRPEGN